MQVLSSLVVSSLAAALLMASSGALAESTNLADTLWRCTRSTDRSQFVITFYPGGGVGGGELGAGEVSPYIYDASATKEGEWPGRWTQTRGSFTWSFPDQQMEISGTIRPAGQAKGQAGVRLAGREVASGIESPIACTRLAKLPRIGDGLVIPRNSRFIDVEKGEGELKVPAGISLRPNP